MKHLMILATVRIPIERIVEDLKDACYNYEEQPSSEKAEEVLQCCHWFLFKHLVGNDYKKALELIKNLEKQERIEDLFNTAEN